MCVQEQFKNNIATLNLYFATLTVEMSVYSEKYTWDSIVSAIGGLVGVWAGASVITVIQALAYFVPWLCDKFKKI
jgi:hypothetical protein